MPVSVVHTIAEEEAWERAKAVRPSNIRTRKASTSTA